MSEKLNVFEAITAVAKEVGAVGKDSVNQAQKFRFRGIDAVVNAVSPAMRKHGLVIFPVVESVKRGTAATSRGGTMNTVEVIAGYVFTGPDGSTFTSKVPGEAFDSGDKATSKAMSVAFRTALLQTFVLPTDDTDPDADSYEAHHQRFPQPQQNPDTYQHGSQQGPSQGHPSWGQQQAPPQQQPQHPAVDWAKEILKARNSRESLLALLDKAKGMGAPQIVIDQITQEGQNLAERKTP